MCSVTICGRDEVVKQIFMGISSKGQEYSGHPQCFTGPLYYIDTKNVNYKCYLTPVLQVHNLAIQTEGGTNQMLIRRCPEQRRRQRPDPKTAVPNGALIVAKFLNA